MFSKKKTFDPTEPLSPDQLLSRLENFCAYRERCPKEVRAKLTELGADAVVALEVYKVLESDKFFDEQRFALAYAGGKFRNNNWGKVRIRQELRMRDIAPDIIEEALDSIEGEAYEALLLKLFEKKRLQYAGDDKALEKSAASLIRAGFETALVFKNMHKFR